MARKTRQTRLKLEALESREVPAAIGSLDPSFDLDGRQNVPFLLGGNTHFDQAQAIAVQPDGKIVVAGSVSRGPAGDNDFGLVRLNPDGTLDTSFGIDNGKVVVGFDLGGVNEDKATGLAIQPDGKIVVVGSVQISAAGDYNYGIARLNANGTLDTTFDTDGRQTVAFDRGGNKRDVANGVAVQTDGKIVVVGDVQFSAAGDIDFGIARLTAAGALDVSFDGDGRRTIGFDLGGNNVDGAAGVAIQSDGAIVVAGSVQRSAAGDFDFGIVRLTAAGAPDTSFDTDGRQNVLFDIGGTKQDVATGLAIQSDGGIVVAGRVQISAAGDIDFGVARLTPNGTLDATFDTDGRQTVAFDLGGSKVDIARGVAIDAAGRIVLAGIAQTSAASADMAVARLTPVGALDATFDFDSKQTVNFNLGGANSDSAAGVAIQADGKILVAGFTKAATGNDFAVARLIGTSSAPGPLLVTGPGSGSGTLFTPAGGAYGAGTSVALVPNFTGDLHPALGDVNGDGVLDQVVGTGTGSRVRVLSGAGGAALADFEAFPGYTGGVYVAVGDLNNDGRADVAVVPDAADAFSGPVDAQLPVKVFNGSNFTLMASFDGLASLDGASGQAAGTRLGGRAAIADVNGDGLPDLLIAAGNGGGPRITIWNGSGFALAGGSKPVTSPLANLFVFEEAQRGGAFVAAGDITGDGFAEIVAGGGPGGGPRVRVVNAAKLFSLPNQGVSLDDPANLSNGLVLNNFFAGDVALRNGVRVTTRDVDGDGRADLVTGSGPTEPSSVRVYKAASLKAVSGTSSEPANPQTFDPFSATLPGGVYVG